MPRSPRADEAGALYHALNRGNARQRIFFKEADYEAFKRLIAEGLEKFEVDLGKKRGGKKRGRGSLLTPHEQ